MTAMYSPKDKKGEGDVSSPLGGIFQLKGGLLMSATGGGCLLCYPVVQL